MIFYMKKKHKALSSLKLYLPLATTVLLCILFITMGFFYVSSKKNVSLHVNSPVSRTLSNSRKDTLDNMRLWTTPMNWSENVSDTSDYKLNGRELTIHGYSMQSLIGYKLEDKLDSLFISNELLTTELALEHWIRDEENMNQGQDTALLVYKRDVGTSREVLKIVQNKDNLGMQFSVFYSDSVNLE